MTNPTNPTASWTIELNVDCPGCKEYVNLLDYPDFWDGGNLQVAEHGTPRSDNLEVICPECGHEFTVTCEY